MTSNIRWHQTAYCNFRRRYHYFVDGPSSFSFNFSHAVADSYRHLEMFKNFYNFFPYIVKNLSHYWWDYPRSKTFDKCYKKRRLGITKIISSRSVVDEKSMTLLTLRLKVKSLRHTRFGIFHLSFLMSISSAVFFFKWRQRTELETASRSAKWPGKELRAVETMTELEVHVWNYEDRETKFKSMVHFRGIESNDRFTL